MSGARVRMRARASRVLPLGLAAALSVALAVTGAEARLPVQVRAGACTIEAPLSLERQAGELAGRASDILPRLERRLGIRPAGRFRMLLLPPGGARDPEAALIDSRAPEWAAGYMIASERTGAVRVGMASRYPYGTVESVFAHETVHLLLHDATGDALPRWFNEGVATLEGRRWGLEDAVLYSSALLTSRLPRFEQLDVHFSGTEASARLAYAASFAFVAWCERHYGPTFIRDVVAGSASRPFADVWARVAGVPVAESEAKWRGETLLRFRWLPIATAGGLLWAMLGLLTFVGGVRKKAKARAVRARWAERERLEDEATPPEGEERDRPTR